MERIYACIDLKSFYASVEASERKLDTLTTNIVVADASRTSKTICLAVSPALKKYGLSGRSRLFEVEQKVKEINKERRNKINNQKFTGKSYNEVELANNPYLELDFIIAKPRMAYYMKYSNMIYDIYLKYLSKDDMFVYSIDEVFLDLTDYIKYYKMDALTLVSKLIKKVYDATGIIATGGVGTNLYLAKIAMDIVAKHVDANKDGVRIAYLDEITYRQKLWDHLPLTDFWQLGPGTARTLNKNKIYTQGDIALCAVNNENLLYKLFGIKAEILIDHAFGYEPCTIKIIKEAKPKSNSISSGQVLHMPYSFTKCELIIKEMADLLSLDLVKKNLVTKQLALTIGYDIKNIDDGFNNNVVVDRYGRKIPKQAHGSINMEYKTSNAKIIMEALVKLYERICNKNYLIRRINITACDVQNKDLVKKEKIYKQIDLFNDFNEEKEKYEESQKDDEEEEKLSKTLLDIKAKYGKNAILKGMNLQKEGTTISRNKQVGGHNE